MASTSQSSGLIPVTAGQIVGSAVGRNYINTVNLQPGASATIYDNASAASGLILFTGVNSGTTNLLQHFPTALRCDNGLFIVVSGTTSGVIVGFGGV